MALLFIITTRVQFWVTKYSTNIFSLSHPELKMRLHSQKNCPSTIHCTGHEAETVYFFPIVLKNIKRCGSYKLLQLRAQVNAKGQYSDSMHI